jgi:hypothetical protein
MCPSRHFMFRHIMGSSGGHHDEATLANRTLSRQQYKCTPDDRIQLFNLLKN